MAGVQGDNITVTGLGALNIDNIGHVERILGDGETAVDREHVEGPPEAEIKWAGAFPGGSAANTIYGLARLGVKTGFSGVIGDDAEGKILLRDFQAVGVDTSQVKIKKQATTGSVVCFSDSSGKRSLYVLPGANSLLTIDDLDLSYINQAGIFHISSFVDDKQFKVLLEVIDNLAPNIKVSFSPGTLYASKGLETLAPILSRTRILFINEQEIRQLTGQDVPAGAESCLKQGCNIVVVTLGEGMKLKLGAKATQRMTYAVCYIRDAQNEYTVEPHREGLVFNPETIGAGDAFAAGFLYGLLKGKTLDKCGRLGDITARFSLSQAGARQGLPTLNELSQRYRELYNKEL